MKIKLSGVVLACAATMGSPAVAEVTVGVSLASTGQGASLAIPMRNAFAVLPDTLGGEKVRYVILDDATDTATAVRNARKLVTDERVDVIIGSSAVPTTTAIAEVASETKTPQISLSPISGGPLAKNKWLFSTSHPTPVMTSAIVEDMKRRKVTRMAYIGFADSWGEQVLSSLAPQAKKAGIEILADERYARTDASVQSQVLKALSAQPEAVVIGASGVASTLPHIALSNRGFKGPVYHTHGAITQDFIRVGGKAVEGAIAPTGPVIVAEQLPDSAPNKTVAVGFVNTYEKKYGPGTRNVFAGYSWDAYMLIDQAVPAALKAGKPGTEQFRQALRDAMESTKELVTAHAVRNLSADDRTGMDERSRVLVTVSDGAWVLKK